MSDRSPVLEDLGDNLILRRATPADAEALAAFNAEVHAEDFGGGTDPSVAALTRDLLTRPHPTFHPELFTIVEDRQTGRIASSLNLIPQTWTYEDLPFAVGRIELVGTSPEYRRRGLVRRQMDVAHRWSAELGHPVQAITGIPWYYRQFGYEMTIALDPSVRLPLSQIPTLTEGQVEPYRVRPATVADLPLIAEWDALGRRRWLVSCQRDAAQWRYELEGRSEENAEAVDIVMIETVTEPAQAAGFCVYRRHWWGSRLAVIAAEVSPRASWPAVAPSLARALRTLGEARAAQASPPTTLSDIILVLGPEHPLRRALANRLAFARPPYAWYIRVADIPAFLRQITPVLERRLATSIATNYTGELALGFYRDGVRLTFTAGKITNISPWPAPDRQDAGVNFPPLTFLHLLFGYRSLADLEAAYADCDVRNHDARLLLDALFPTRPSHIWAVD